ncbi:ribokinase [Myceligenerans salitolerans]|uniref:Ribokinase n=1 Tax=Myceligenerans salitolerans TaxID=1230528 RepID=A0ABS3I5E4_9MICO|nr:ribokinase [Myceligenerans salitolerans]MBO0608230.1 ribokinase [Myceligenerans salitolerans]
MGGRVVVVGSANVDVVVEVPHHPRGGETVLGGDVRRTPGGKGANQAVAAARGGGAETTFVGALGRDEAAELLLSSLERAAVRTDLVDRVAAPTGTALITVTPDGRNAIAVAPGANSHVRVDAARSARLAAADVVLLQLEIPVDAVRSAAAAKRPGALVVLNAAPSRRLPADVWSQIDILVVNETEAADLVAGLPGPTTPATAPADPSALAAALLGRVPAVVVTVGDEGSLVAERGKRLLTIPAHPVRAVDTTGAGDAYCGVLAAALSRGGSLDAAARLANAAAALAVTSPGAQDAIPTAEEVEALAADGATASGRAARHP